MATIILAHEHGIPIDTVIFSEVMFDKNISGELPEHIEFIKTKLKPQCEAWGYDFKILRSDKTYLDCFYQKNRGLRVPERKGMYYGFPMAGKCMINSRCKGKPIKDYLKRYSPEEVIQYIGIAVDEPKRLKRLQGTNKVSLMAEYNYTERMAYELCRRYDLLSPQYDISIRCGCWFCPNARIKELRLLRENHRELWEKLLELEKVPNTIGNCFNVLKQRKVTDLEKDFQYEDMQINLFTYLQKKTGDREHE